MLTRPGLKREAKKRQQADAEVKPVELDPRFSTQNAFILDSARFLDAQCSRRAGKSNGLAIRFYNTMNKYPKSRSVYLALTFESAKDIMMPVLKELNETYRWGCTFLDSTQNALMKHPNGAQLKILGADMSNFIKRLKGRKHPAIGLDEAQDFGPHLRSLVDDVLTPCIADYSDGWLALTGTPGPVPQGFFFEVTKERKYGFSHHEWTILDNIYMPDPKGFLEDLKARRQWSDDNPTLLREWQNKWVLDASSLWVRYDAKLNHFIQLPEAKWNYVLGVDIGFKDADAIAVLAWSESTRDTYLVEECITKKQGISDLIAQIDSLQKKYNAYKIVMDEGGLGKKIAEDLRARFSCPLVPAEKERKQDNIEFLNDDLRLGRFKAKSASKFAQDSYLVQIDWEKSTPKRTVLKKDPHSDIIDAVLYAYRESYSYTHTPEVVAPRVGSKEWADAQQSSMFTAAMEHFEAQEAYDKWRKGEE